MDIALIIAGLAQKYPIIVAILSVIGFLRVIFKPLFTFLHAIADATKSTKDNAILASVEDSKVYKAVVFVLDYIASIKLPQ